MRWKVPSSACSHRPVSSPARPGGAVRVLVVSGGWRGQPQRGATVRAGHRGGDVVAVGGLAERLVELVLELWDFVGGPFGQQSADGGAGPGRCQGVGCSGHRPIISSGASSVRGRVYRRVFEAIAADPGRSAAGRRDGAQVLTTMQLGLLPGPASRGALHEWAIQGGPAPPVLPLRYSLGCAGMSRARTRWWAGG